ncbi:MAG: hypothetical protein L3J73_02505 [Thermoplasmata archaeon]|nr:hypothetical protein [Thermoplasmata archaeon]
MTVGRTGRWGLLPAFAGEVVTVSVLTIGAVTGLLYVRGGVPAIVQILPIGAAAGVGIIALGIYLQLWSVTTPEIRLTDEGICLAPDTTSARFFRWSDVEAPERRGIDGWFGLFTIGLKRGGHPYDSIELTKEQTRRLVGYPNRPQWPVDPSILRAIR